MCFDMFNSLSTWNVLPTDGENTDVGVLRIQIRLHRNVIAFNYLPH